METNKSPKHFLNPISTTFLLILFAISIGLYYFEAVNEIQLAGLLIFSIYIKFYTYRRPVGESCRIENGKI